MESSTPPRYYSLLPQKPFAQGKCCNAHSYHFSILHLTQNYSFKQHNLCLPCCICLLKINPCGSRTGLQILSLSAQPWQGSGRNCVISGKGSIWGRITSACAGISCQEFLLGIVCCGNASARLQPSWWAPSSSSWALPLELDVPVVPWESETLQRAAQSFCACCQQNLLRRSFSRSSSFGLPFFLVFHDIPRKGEHGGNVLMKESLWFFFPRWIAKEAKQVKPDQMPLAGVNWGSFRCHS